MGRAAPWLSGMDLFFQLFHNRGVRVGGQLFQPDLLRPAAFALHEIDDRGMVVNARIDHN